MLTQPNHKNGAIMRITKISFQILGLSPEPTREWDPNNPFPHSEILSGAIAQKELLRYL